MVTITPSRRVPWLSHMARLNPGVCRQFHGFRHDRNTANSAFDQLPTSQATITKGDNLLKERERERETDSQTDRDRPAEREDKIMLY